MAQGKVQWQAGSSFVIHGAGLELAQCGAEGNDEGRGGGNKLSRDLAIRCERDRKDGKLPSR